jgi:hypothetical protein
MLIDILASIAFIILYVTCFYLVMHILFKD